MVTRGLARTTDKRGVRQRFLHFWAIGSPPHSLEQAVLVDDAERVVLVDLHGGTDEAVLDGR